MNRFWDLPTSRPLQGSLCWRPIRDGAPPESEAIVRARPEGLCLTFSIFLRFLRLSHSSINAKLSQTLPYLLGLETSYRHRPWWKISNHLLSPHPALTQRPACFGRKASWELVQNLHTRRIRWTIKMIHCLDFLSQSPEHQFQPPSESVHPHQSYKHCFSISHSHCSMDFHVDLSLFQWFSSHPSLQRPEPSPWLVDSSLAAAPSR